MSIVGTQREFFAMAHAAQKTIVTVEKIHEGDLLRDPLLAAGTLPGFYVEAVAVEPRGSWPLPLPDHYGIDAAHMAEYAQLAATPEGFAQYLDRYVYENARRDRSHLEMAGLVPAMSAGNEFAARHGRTSPAI